MLSIGEFANICKISTKTLRHYDEIGLLIPAKINRQNGYRYYSIEQLDTMLFINKLKEYSFSLEEIKNILKDDDLQGDMLHRALLKKKIEIEGRLQLEKQRLKNLELDIYNIESGRSIMNYSEDIDLQLVDVDKMNILSIRKMVQEGQYSKEYMENFTKLFKKIATESLTIVGSPMVMFHSSEYTPYGMDTTFAIPIKECVKGTVDFYPGLCLKTTMYGDYNGIPAVYTKHIKWIEKEGYEYSDALFEVYVTDQSQVKTKEENITEIYSPIKKIHK